MSKKEFFELLNRLISVAREVSENRGAFAVGGLLYSAKIGISDPAEEFLLKQIDLMFGGPELPSGLRIPVR